MRYSIYNFAAREVIGMTFEPADKDKMIVDLSKQCFVLQATTPEDERYLGSDWQCQHCLPPEECTLCNPKYRNSYLEECPRCTPAFTHHVDGNCLKCEGELS